MNNTWLPAISHVSLSVGHAATYTSLASPFSHDIHHNRCKVAEKIGKKCSKYVPLVLQFECFKEFGQMYWVKDWAWGESVSVQEVSPHWYGDVIDIWMRTAV